jgi:septal ring factor EnvC (AmiA/AmiB activator)
LQVRILTVVQSTYAIAWSAIVVLMLLYARLLISVLLILAAADVCHPQHEMEAGQLEAALKQKEAEAAATAQERDQLRSKLQLLQNQILRGDGTPHKVQPAGRS